MTEWSMPEVVGEGNGFGEVLVEIQRTCDGACDRGDFDGMCEACPVMVAASAQEDLGFVFQAAERMTVQNPVAVALEIGAERMCFFRVASSPRADIVSGIRRQFRFFQIVLIFQFPYHGTPLHPVLICSGIFQRTQKTDFRADSVPPLFRFLLPWKPAVRTAPACIP